MDFSEILEGIPDYREYMGVDQLNASSEEMAENHPETVKRFELGKSGNGEGIECLKIGGGNYKALVYGFPNPEEPLGGVLLEYFSKVLAEDEVLLKRLDYTWYIVKCIDPDGARLNEGYLKGPFTPLNFTKNYYRTPNSLTGEFNFPYRYGDLDFNNPLPETKALMRIMDETTLDFISSLHNMKWGGITYEVPGPCTELYPILYKLARDHNIFLRKRIGTTIAPGIQQAGYFTPVRNYVNARAAGKGPLEEITGAYIYEYAQLRNPEVFMMVPECCLWYDERMWDDAPSDTSLQDVVEYSREVGSETRKFLLSIYDKAEPLLSGPSPFREMMKEHIDGIRNPVTVVSDPSPVISKNRLKQLATVAEKVGMEGRADVYRIFYLGGLIRMLDHEISHGSGSKGKLQEHKEQASGKLEEWNAIIGEKYDVKAWPIRDLLGMNLGSILHSALYAKWKNMWYR
jgi:hypothetical protein